MNSSQIHICREDGWWRTYRVVNGKYRLIVGPKFDTVKAAAMYADLLENTPETSPLRDGRAANTGFHRPVGDALIPDQSGQ